MGLNDAFAKPLRSFIICLNLTLGVIGLIFGLILNSTIKTYAATPALLGFVYDATVTRQEMSHHRAKRLLQTAPGVEAFYGQQIIEAETLQGQSFKVKAVDGNLAPFPFVISKGRLLQPNTYEAIAGQGLLNWLALKIGDELTVLINDKPITWHIVGQYPEPANAGQMLMVNLATMGSVLKQTKPNTYQLKFSPEVNLALLKHHLAPKPESDLNLTLVGQIIPDSIIYLQAGVFALVAILIGIALVNVFNTSLQAIQEKLRSIGILKTVGMTPAQIITMVNTTTGFLGFLATGLGIPLGWGFSKGILTTLAHTYGFGEVHVTLNLIHIILLFPLMVGISITGSYIPSRQAAKLAIVKVLRNE